MGLLREYADDLPLQEWLKWVWPIEKHMTPHDIYEALLTAVESMISGRART